MDAILVSLHTGPFLRVVDSRGTHLDTEYAHHTSRAKLGPLALPQGSIFTLIDSVLGLGPGREQVRAVGFEL